MDCANRSNSYILVHTEYVFTLMTAMRLQSCTSRTIHDIIITMEEGQTRLPGSSSQADVYTLEEEIRVKYSRENIISSDNYVKATLYAYVRTYICMYEYMKTERAIKRNLDLTRAIVT